MAILAEVKERPSESGAIAKTNARMTSGISTRTSCPNSPRTVGLASGLPSFMKTTVNTTSVRITFLLGGWMVDLDSGVDKEKICKAWSLPQRLQDRIYPVSVDRTYTDGVADL